MRRIHFVRLGHIHSASGTYALITIVAPWAITGRSHPRANDTGRLPALGVARRPRVPRRSKRSPSASLHPLRPPPKRHSASQRPLLPRRSPRPPTVHPDFPLASPGTARDRRRPASRRRPAGQPHPPPPRSVRSTTRLTGRRATRRNTLPRSRLLPPAAPPPPVGAPRPRGSSLAVGAARAKPSRRRRRSPGRQRSRPSRSPRAPSRRLGAPTLPPPRWR